MDLSQHDCSDSLNQEICSSSFSFFFSVYHQFLLFLNTQPSSILSFRSKNPVFKEVLTRIEGHPDCRNLPMISFLILPMQRITRLPLLMDVSALKTYSSMSFGMTRLSLLRNALFIHTALTNSP